MTPQENIIKNNRVLLRSFKNEPYEILPKIGTLMNLVSHLLTQVFKCGNICSMSC